MAIVFSTEDRVLTPRPDIGWEVVIRMGIFRGLHAVVREMDAEGTVLALLPGFGDIYLERLDYLTVAK